MRADRPWRAVVLRHSHVAGRRRGPVLGPLEAGRHTEHACWQFPDGGGVRGLPGDGMWPAAAANCGGRNRLFAWERYTPDWLVLALHTSGLGCYCDRMALGIGCS